MIMVILMELKKSLTVNPNSELIFEFNTMTTKNYQGVTNLIIKNADNDTVIAEKSVAYGPIGVCLKCLKMLVT